MFRGCRLESAPTLLAVDRLVRGSECQTCSWKNTKTARHLVLRLRVNSFIINIACLLKMDVSKIA